MPNDQITIGAIPYLAPLLGNIRQILTGLQGFDSMAREIIQNADDAGARKICFSIEPCCLRVWNDEIFRSCGLTDPRCPWELERSPTNESKKSCDFHAISTVGSGNKYRDPSLIGRFGIGFVSVYQITDTPIIRSLGVELQLDPLRERNSVSAIHDLQGSEFELPWAFDKNSTIREALNASAIEPNDLDSIQSALELMAKDCLLFLRNLQSIEIIRDGIVIKHVLREAVDQNRVQISFVPDKYEENWYVIHTSADKEAGPLRDKYPAIERLARQTALQIAFNLSQHDDRLARLFAYLPTEQESPVPCHINADFFPEQNRKALVLSGEQHERHWNEMLLGVAAREISEHLLQLRDVLGPVRLWRLISEAFQHRESAPFRHFWEAIGGAARGSDILWTAGERWISPDKARIPSRHMTEDQERSLTHISVNLIHRSLRPFQNALEALGTRPLDLGAIVDALGLWDEVELDSDMGKGREGFNSLIRPLWSITDTFVSSGNASPEIRGEILTRLRKIRFAPEPKGTLAPIDDLYKLPKAISNKDIEKYMSGLPLVHEAFGEFQNLYNLVHTLSFEHLLDEIAARVKDDASAKAFFGSDSKRIRQFYRFLSSYPRPEGLPNVAAVSDSPILAGHDRFLTPAEAVLPGGFQDPVGRFDTLDITYYDDRSQEFLREILRVRPLTLDTYIRAHLSDILAEGLSDGQYVALLQQLTSHQELLDDDEIRRILSNLPIVKTMAKNMRRPGECYFKTAELTELLGDERGLWVETSVFKTFQADVVQAFLTQLGMRRRPSLEHALDRIEGVIAQEPSEETRGAISNLLHFVLEVFEEDHLSDREDEFEDEIERLRNIEWLPASRNGVLDVEAWYAPHELYQPFRAAGFESQAPVLAIRQNPRKPLTRDFLDFLNMPAVPGTAVIVEHLIQCAHDDKQASELTYQILSEKLREGEGIAWIEALRSHECVYSPALKSYVATDRIFWSKPRLPRYCFQAPEWMHRYKDLFDFLGVEEEPHGSTYSGVLKDIARDFGGRSEVLPAEIQLISEICLKALASELRGTPSRIRHLLEELEKHPFLVTVAGTLAFPNEVAIKDSEWLAEPFGDELNGRLIYRSPEYSEILDWLELATLSSVTHLQAVRVGEEISDEDATEKIAERRDLLLWLFAGIRGEPRRRIDQALRAMQVSRADYIQVRTVFTLTDPPIVSTPKSEQVLFDKAAQRLYLHLDLGEAYWIPAFRSIFSTLVSGEDGVDVRQFALNASHVLLAPSVDEARKQLQQAGFAPPSSDEPSDVEFDETDLGDISMGGEPSETAGDAGGAHPQETANRTRETDDIGKAPSSEDESPRTASRKAVGRTEKGNEKEGAEAETRSGDTESGGTEHRISDDKDLGSQNRNARSRRTEWMRSYVVPHSDKTKEKSHSSGEQQARNTAIGESAMNAVIEYEVTRKCSVERMPHLNPGYDIISRSQNSGEKRLIEVKGLDGEWTERGVKLTRTQIMNAEEYGDEFWLYVVEHALDRKQQKLHAIQNPFFKAAEFWFDYVWQDVAEEHSEYYSKARFAPGRKVRHEDWGEGTIIDVQHRGIGSSITIAFPVYGQKNITLKTDRLELIED